MLNFCTRTHCSSFWLYCRQALDLFLTKIDKLWTKLDYSELECFYGQDSVFIVIMTISPFFSSVLLLLMLNTVSESKYIEGQLSTKEVKCV